MPAGPVTPEPPANLTLGRAGEEAAAAFLKSQGYRIRERNWRHKSMELDLICEQGGDLVFVEVKTRASGTLAPGAHSVNAEKRRRLIRAATMYLSKKKLWERPCRFDLVSMLALEDGSFRPRLHKNAFSIEDAPRTGKYYQPF